MCRPTDLGDLSGEQADLSDLGGVQVDFGVPRRTILLAHGSIWERGSIGSIRSQITLSLSYMDRNEQSNKLDTCAVMVVHAHHLTTSLHITPRHTKLAAAMQ